jgi:hypothetical protein
MWVSPEIRRRAFTEIGEPLIDVRGWRDDQLSNPTVNEIGYGVPYLCAVRRHD